MRTGRLFSSYARVFSHENPLGLPRAQSSRIPATNPSAAPSRGAPPTIPRHQRGLPQKRPIPHVRKIIAVSSAKGGVGKSTLAVNLALAFSRHKLRTGILDTDIFGPSIPTLLGLEKSGLPDVTRDGKLVPLRAWGIGSMSMGYLLGKGRKSGTPGEEAKEGTGDGDEEGPVAWRGLMVMKALQQLLHEVQWGGTTATPELDVLVLDMPPGTGDVQLTIGQQVAVDGAVIVSTPQDVALKDAVRGVKMFQKMDIPVLGMVRNMEVFVCPNCGEETRIFAHERPGGRDDQHDGHTRAGGLQQRMQDMGVEVLGQIPLDPQICYDADNGKPTIVAEEAKGVEKRNTRFYEEIARKAAEKVGLPWT